jgi:putative phosphoesterase
MSRTEFIGVISDTHGLLRPEAVEALQGSSLIIHAGDLGSGDILPELLRIAPVHAVRGNVDFGPWADELPVNEVVTQGNHTVFVLHILEQLDLEPGAADVHVIISGHTHQPHIEERGDCLFFNPGSAGPRRGDLPVTVGRLTFPEGKPHAEIVHLSV